MAKPTPKVKTINYKKPEQSKLNIGYLFLLFAYAFITILTPNLGALDSNGPKFLSLAFLNLVTFIFLFSRKEVKSQRNNYYIFFNNGIGIAYSGLMLISLLSFFKSINVLESIVHFSKIVTTFSAAYLISILIIKDKRNIQYLCVALTLLLIVDSFTVFWGINKYVHGKIKIIDEIMSVYSHKNVLASSIFVKIPFALFLFIFHNKWWRTLGIIGLFLSYTATFFLSTRAFYLGLFGLTIVLCLFFIIQFYKTHDKRQLKFLAANLLMVTLAFLIFASTQRYLYPQKKDIYNKSVVSRLASISTTESSAEARLGGWKRSWHVLKDNPILGVGLGNWKIATLKEENLSTRDFNYQVKAHNDFVEITTETGVFGGLLFISIFLLIGWSFLRSVIKKDTPENISLLFIPAFGLFCYSFDAFFNFPQDRPEIQALFALFIGIIISINYLNSFDKTKPLQLSSENKSSFSQRFFTFPFTPFSQNDSRNSKRKLPLFSIILVFGLFMIFSIYILILNFNSLKLQHFVKDDIKRGKLTYPAAMFLNGFPSIPNLTTTASPIAVQKARYLLLENRNQEAIDMLKNDKSNPYDAIRLGLLSEAYLNLKNIDSSLFYSRKMYILKPNNLKNIAYLCDLLQQKGIQVEAEAVIQKYLNEIKDNKEAWLYASSFYENANNIQKATAIIDTAISYFPADSLLLNQKSSLRNKTIIQLYRPLYKSANEAYESKKYKEAERYYSEILAKVTDFTEARIRRAFCFYFLKEYDKSNLDLELLISSGVTQSNLFNLRGVNFNNLKNRDEACKYFKIAADKGDKDAIGNYNKFCQTGEKPHN